MWIMNDPIHGKTRSKYWDSPVITTLDCKIVEFTDECIERDPSGSIREIILYDAFKKWYELNYSKKHSCPHTREFYDYIHKIYGDQTGISKKGTVWYGITIVDFSVDSIQLNQYAYNQPIHIFPNKLNKPVEIQIAVPVEKYKKIAIPKKVKMDVWNTYIGADLNAHKCLCCKITRIQIMDFQLGHVQSEKEGGTSEIKNLRPICSACNFSMGSQNMIDFVKKYGYYIG